MCLSLFCSLLMLGVLSAGEPPAVARTGISETYRGVWNLTSLQVGDDGEFLKWNPPIRNYAVVTEFSITYFDGIVKTVDRVEPFLVKDMPAGIVARQMAFMSEAGHSISFFKRADGAVVMLSMFEKPGEKPTFISYASAVIE